MWSHQLWWVTFGIWTDVTTATDRVADFRLPNVLYKEVLEISITEIFIESTRRRLERLRTAITWVRLFYLLSFRLSPAFAARPGNLVAAQRKNKMF
jgi:hypothetical protein